MSKPIPVHSLELAIAVVRDALEQMTPDERLEYRSLLFPYCDHCGGPKRDERGQQCQCWNDE